MGPAARQPQGASAVERLAAAVREDVLEGRLAPGAPLTEVALASRFAVSRSTVREALRALAHSGLVRLERHRGATVTRVTAEDLADLGRARTALEGAAAEAAVAGHLGALEAALASMEDAVARADADAVVEADLAFHAALVALLGSHRLDAAYAALQNELRLALTVAGRRVAAPGKVAEHERLLALARGGDAAALRAALAGHVAAGVADQRAALGAGGAPGRPPA